MSGRIVLTTGPMFAGKTYNLIREYGDCGVRVAESAAAFKPLIDNRSGPGIIRDHRGNAINARTIRTMGEILDVLREMPKVVSIFIDEGQFLADLAEGCAKLRDLGYGVHVYALDTDYRFEEWPATRELMKIADFVNYLTARCNICGKRATLTHRKTTSTEIILIGSEDIYEPICRECATRAKNK